MSTSNPTSNPIFLSDTPEMIKNKIICIKKVGAGSFDVLFESGANLDSDTLIELARLFEKNNDLLNIIEKGYSLGFDNTKSEDLANIEYIKNIIPEKGIKSRDTKTMITTFGIRCYLINLIIFKFF